MKLLFTLFIFPVWAIGAENGLYSFLQPLLPIYLLFCVLVLVDLRLGICTARKRKERIRRSRAVRRTLSKFADYCSIVTACKLFDMYIISEFQIPLVFITFCLILAWVELDSIFSNFGELRDIRVAQVVRQFLTHKLDVILPGKSNDDSSKSQ